MDVPTREAPSPLLFGTSEDRTLLRLFGGGLCSPSLLLGARAGLGNFRFSGDSAKNPPAS